SACVARKVSRPPRRISVVNPATWLFRQARESGRKRLASAFISKASREMLRPKEGLQHDRLKEAEELCGIRKAELGHARFRRRGTMRRMGHFGNSCAHPYL